MSGTGQFLNWINNADKKGIYWLFGVIFNENPLEWKKSM